MKLLILTCLALFLALLVAKRQAEGAYIYLRPLSADEVYRTLRSAGQEDAVPEGRIVTQGISALTGFGLGLAKGIGGAALVGALAGAGIGGVSLAALLGQSTNSTAGVTITTQEICFNSRSLNDGEEMGTDRKLLTGLTTGTTGSGTGTGTGTTGTTGTTGATSPTTSSTSPVTTTGATGTSTDNGSGSGTATEETTETGGEGSTNCIVIQKPK